MKLNESIEILKKLWSPSCQHAETETGEE